MLAVARTATLVFVVLRVPLFVCGAGVGVGVASVEVGDGVGVTAEGVFPFSSQTTTQSPRR